MLRRISILILVYFTATTSFAQLRARFNVSVDSGCAPLLVNFTNTTTGTSPTVTYKWDFGNGGTSTIIDAGTTYASGNVYKVTLTATDKGVTSIATRTITVFKPPVVAFAVNQAAGCAPLTSKFASRSTAGDGVISNYIWDFGDGYTDAGGNLKDVFHVYQAARKPQISLTVVNSKGCVASLTQGNILQVYKQVSASFTPSALQVCQAGDSFVFTNTSTGDKPLVYDWDFGNGTKSNLESPVYSYPVSGIYTVKMSATNAIGCASRAISLNVNVGNFTAGFSMPAALCINQTTAITNTSTRPYDSAKWTIDNVPVPTDQFGNASYIFPKSDSFTIKLTSFYKGCQRTAIKTIFIGSPPILKGFVIDNGNICNLPITFTFTDTTKEAVKWTWRYLNNATIFDSVRTTSRSYPDSGTDRIGLTVTNVYGCEASAARTIQFYTPTPAIIIKKSSSSSLSPNRGCPGLKITFSTTPAKEITRFSWDFGDGGPLSVFSEPTRTFDKLGSYSVKLTYQTKNGCRGTIQYDSIFVNNIAPFDFTVAPGRVICGNSITSFSPTVSLRNRDYIWYVDKVPVLYSLTPAAFEYRFEQPGFHTISLVMASGTCRSTVTKTNFIEVLPPFPKIDSVINTCAGNRATVTFIDSSHDISNWNWDFGDGNTLNYNTYKNTISHTYAASGSYTAKLTSTSGQCVVTDTMPVFVLLKQKPLLSANLANTCTSDSPFVSIVGYETNPAAGALQPYNITGIQFGDLTFSNATINAGYWQNNFNARITDLEPGKQDLRIITSSEYFKCADTSNFISLKTLGPIAAFNFLPVECLNQVVTVSDGSATPGNIPLVEWRWDFGDSTIIVANSGAPVSHTYAKPGTYIVTLLVTDANGCSNNTNSDSAHTITVSGPKAAFNVSSKTVLVNSSVDFTNRSLYMENSTLIWKFPNNLLIAEQNPEYIFNKEGEYVITLIAKNSISGCTDSAQQTISVKSLRSNFTYQIKYLTQSNCPPVLVTFTSQSINADSLRWTFGDGTGAEYIPVTTHVYTSAGSFFIKLYAYDKLGRVDSFEQKIDVSGPFAFIKADKLFGCNTVPVRFSADTVNTVNFKWDFGDGNILPGTDTFTNHVYQTPGGYQPAMILEDRSGCVSISKLGATIVVDSLNGIINSSNDGIVCTSSVVTFNSLLSSYSSNNLAAKINYAWTSSQHPNDIKTSQNAQWLFTKSGIGNIRLIATTPFGCSIQFDKKVEVLDNYTAAIIGPSFTCIGDSISFKGSVSPAVANIAFTWDLVENGLSNLQNPPTNTYNTAGVRRISLVADAGYCPDTTFFQVDIKGKPVLDLRSSKPYVCNGNTDTLFSNRFKTINWTPAVQSLFNGDFSAVIKPSINTTYFADVTDVFGCVNSDSILVKVIDKFQLQTDRELFTCAGNSIKLKASGGDRYLWKGNGFSTNEATPTIIPQSSQIIKVVAYDDFNCFSDSALINLRVGQLPFVKAGPDLTLISGQTVTLQSQSGSTVVKWNWSPSQYLSCSDCPEPLATPLRNTTYVLTVSTADGCISSDTIKIEMLCGKDLIWIPTGFTPNGDRLNDRFNVRGSGITVKRLAIFDRWGKIVFDKNNYDPYDTDSGWDGNYQSKPMASGGYVYVTEVMCNSSGEKFSFKGTFTLVR